MRIIIDAMSGDNAPLEIIKGVGLAKEECKNDTFILVGKDDEIRRIAEENSIDISDMEIVNADVVITMEDDPISVVRAKKDSSMSVALGLLSEGKGNVCVSAGNTGALFTGASLIVRKMKGILRPAIATVLPFNPPVILLDSGANLVVSEDNLEQFACMGTTYMRKMHGVENPRVGLLNNGEEQTKGLPLQIESYKRLMACDDINFVGNIEANRLMKDTCDVIVTDGFTGNILLKTIEGMGKMALGVLKDIFNKNIFTYLAAAIVKKPLYAVKKSFDPAEHGGAPILGVQKPVIKAHGSSKAKAFKSAIMQAKRYASSGIIEEIAKDALEFAAKRKAEKAAKSE
jgi:glycerol-3-phosphate acyltransferase PlsX